MARTPLARAVELIAREHDAAERLGLTPAQLREQQADRAFTRREILRRGVAAGAVVTVGSGLLATAARAASGPPRVAIVGAGIAGLNAALTLQDKGIAATVYESSDRVGGRMHSERSGYWASGQVTEICGELIDTNHTATLALAQRFELPVADLLSAEPPGSTPSYWFLGGRYSVEQVDADFVPVREALKRDLTAAGYPTRYDKFKPAGVELDRMSLYEWIESRVPGGHSSAFGRLLDVAYAEEYGGDTTDQSSLNLVYLLGYQPSPKGFSVFGVSDEKWHIVGGNERLPEAMAAALPDVRTGWRMTSVARNADGSVALGFDTPGGSVTVNGDRVILTVPFQVLRTLDTTRAGFDERKRRAIAELGSGSNAKLLLQFTSRYWNTSGPWGNSSGDSYSDLGYQNTWETTRAQSGAPGILVNYTGGSVAAAFTQKSAYATAADDPKVAGYARAFLKQLEVVFPGITARWNGKATLSTPSLDPNLLSSYSFWRPGQYVAFGGYEAVPQGAIHFAGEHCSQDFQGYMEGGAREGKRAALEVAHALTGK